MTNLELGVIRSVLAAIWLITALLSFGLYPVEHSLELLQAIPLERQQNLILLYAGASLDLLLGVLTLAWPRRLLWTVQGGVVLGYTVLATLLVPEMWLHPFGPLLKNLAVLTLIWLLYRYADQERKSA